MEIEFSLSPNFHPVEDFMSTLDPKTHKKILRNLELFEKDSTAFILHSDMFKKMDGHEKYNLWEFRIFFNKKKYRILCCLRGGKCYLVHGFIKKTQKTPPSHITTAIGRIKNYLSNIVHNSLQP